MAKSKGTEKIQRIKNEYHRVINNYGAQIVSINRITRSRMDSPNMFKNADFSPKTIRRLIDEGEKKAIDFVDGNKQTRL